MTPYILHIEDDPVIQQIVAEALRRRWPQAQMRQAGSLSEATNALATHPLPDILLSDNQLPDGRSIHWIGQQDQIQNIPVIIMSGTSLSLAEQNKLGKRPFLILQKPIRPQDIIQALQSLLIPSGT